MKATFHRVLAVLVFFVSLPLLAQSADQAVTASDSPDPVIPGAVLTYNISVTNNGPNAAVNGGFNANLDGNLAYIGTTAPAGFTCFVSGNNVSCINPSFPAGTANFVMTATVAAHLANFPDGTLTSNFFPSGTTPDPNPANNNVSVTTTYDSPQVDLSLTVTDNPDPVTPDNDITYTVPVRNDGPDTATSVNFNVFNNGTLQFRSATVPAGWNCTLPALNGTPNFTCTNPSFAPGTSNFTVVLRASSAVLGVNDGTVSTVFSVNGTGDDTNDGNNQEQEDTAYVTPDADMSVAVTDSPDPVFPDGNITYTVTVGNNGPDTAPNVNLSSFGSNNLRFVSATVPAGWNCTLPAAGAQTAGFNCTLSSMVSGDSDVLTFVLQADDALLGTNDGTIQFGFSTNSSIADPAGGNNSETESTAYVTPDADMTVAVTDSPDPVFPDGNITYTVTVGNNGPDTAPNVNLSSFGNNNLRFVSATVPAGWNCTLPAAGAQTAGFNCTLSSMASGDSDVLTFVLQADDALLGTNDGTIQFGFSTNSSIADPAGGNNSETESTAYVTPDADLSVAVTDSPDPVFPDGNITYTVTVMNNGPDTAPDARMNVFNNGTLQFQSATVPAGWNCTLPAANATPTFSCTNPSFANGASSVFTIVVRADGDDLGINDRTVSTNFNVTSDVADPVNANSSETENTAYVTPDADLSVAVTDSPDPVTPDNNITYTVTVMNNGPDTAPDARMNVFNNGTLQFQSATVPAGWNCTLPAANATPTFSCTNPSFANGATSVFTIVVRADGDDLGINDRTLSTNFNVTSDIADPVNANSSETENTAYVTPDANLGVTASDAPDPVTPGNNITYTGTVTNAGPDAGENVIFTAVLNGNLQFQSLVGPAGFTCTTPALGANGTITCTIASLPSGAALPYTLVARVDPSLASGPDGTISQTFVIGDNTNDPVPANDTATVVTAYTTPDADLSTTNADSPDPVAPGANITYTQTMTNNGPQAAVNAQLSETLPASVGFVSLAAPAGYTCVTPAVGASGTITCSIASLASGVTSTFTVVVNVLASSGTVSNTTTVDSDTFDPDNTDNTATVTTTITAAPSADLSITKNTAATTAAPNSTFTYTIVVTNGGPSAASNVVMTDTLPAQLRFQSITTPAGFTCATPAVGATGTITCNAATLANGATATFTLTVRVAANATGTINNTAAVSSATSDPNGGNSSGSAPGVVVPAPSADLSISKNTTTANAPAGSTFQYSIVITNGGPDAASGVVMTDTLPASLLFVSLARPAAFTCTTPAVGATGTITCNAATLASGATATFTLTVRVASSATSGSATNSASVTSTTGDPDAGDTTDAAPPVTLGPASADLSIVKMTTSTTAPTGGIVSYTIDVTNAGPSQATNVVVTDTLPSGLELISATPSQGTCSGTTTITCNLGTLANGASATINLQTRVTATSGTISNTASVDGNEPDPDGGDVSSGTPPIPVGEPAALSDIPTLSEWVLMLFAAMLGLVAMLKVNPRA